ncbi:MAG: HEAT repeat domain-containing protein [Chloroflexi bacterium]|nr:HEAT repeat domain-containing protein [Chloroflexota bacterium]
MTDLDSLLSDLTSGDDELAEKAALAIQGYGQNAVTKLSQLITDPDPDIRWWAVRALAEFYDGNTTDLIINTLGDDDQDVKQCALLAMRNRPDSNAIPILTQFLGDEHSLLSRLAVDALIAIGKDATPALLEILEYSDNIARLASVQALAKIGDYASVSSLFLQLDSNSAIMDYWANEGLKKMGIGMSFFKPT